MLIKTAVTVHHVGARRTSFLGHLGSMSCQKKCVKCHRVNPGRTTLHVPKFECQEKTICRTLPATITLTRYQNCSSIGSVRGRMNATLLQRIPRSTVIAQLGGPNTAELSHMLQNMVILVCDFRVQSCRHRARRGLLVLLAGTFSLSQNRWGARRMRQSHKTDAVGHVTAGAGSASFSATSPVVPLAATAGVSSVCFFPSSPRHTAALVDAPLRSVCRASPRCGKPHRTAPPTHPTPSLRPRSPPSSTPHEVCLETMEFDIRCGHGTTTHAPRSSPQRGLGHDKHALPDRAFLAPAPSRAAAHLVITRKEIRCTRCYVPK